MSLFSEISEVVSELADVRESRDRWIRPLEHKSRSELNHSVLFLKPEVLAINSGVNVDAILELLRETLRAHDLEIGAVRALNGPYLAEHRIMEGHYGVINRVSRKGEGALSERTRNRLVEKCEGGDLHILGAHQFLQQFPQVSAFALNMLADSLGPQKIASGKYYIQANVSGERIIVLNPFHPLQLQHFTLPGCMIVVFECWTNTSWRTLRQQMTGATDPSVAELGSLRRTLYDRMADFGLRSVRTATNGLHFSAGPLEAMVEYTRFFSDHANNQMLEFAETPFGQILASRGLNNAAIAALAENPVIKTGGQLDYAFNLTEEINADSAAQILGAEVSAA